MEQEKMIYSKIAAIMKSVKAIGKDRKNEQQGFKFRGIDDVMNELHEAFAVNEVFIIPELITREETERQSAQGKALFYVRCTMKFTLMTTDGSSISTTLIGEGMDSGDKGTNKAMSIALKYALLQMFLIPTEEPKDTDAETHEIKPIKKEAPKALPNLTQKLYGDTLSRILAGETDLLQKCEKAFTITEEQRTNLAAAVKTAQANAIKNQAPGTPEVTPKSDDKKIFE